MEKFKALLTAMFGALSSLFGALAIPIILLVLCNVIDYGTGIAASKYRNEKINSYKGLRGIIKKVCMWLLIVVGAIIDQLLLYAAGQVGINIPFTFAIACVVAIWLVCNELISILENIADIGVPLPAFLNKIVKNIKSQIEEKTDIKDENKDESED